MEENSINIHVEAFDADFDEIGWDPIKVDDSDSDAAELFGY